MNAPEAIEYNWPYLLTFLPSEPELERTARAFGAIKRKRKIDSAAQLLRLALAYAVCGMSLRNTAAWAELLGLASLSNVALFKRLRVADAWLGHILGGKLAENASIRAVPSFPYHLRVVDATCLNRPGTRGTDLRLHLGFNLDRLMFDHMEITDHAAGESLRRFVFHPGDLVLADRGYAHRAGIASVVAAQAHVLIRLNWQNVPLLDPDGTPFDLIAALRSLDDAVPGSFPVIIAPSTRDRTPAIPARLLAVRNTEAVAEAARTRVRQERTRKQQSLDPRTLETAGYVFVLTTVPEEHLSVRDGLELYRFRWQIELAIKHLKGILDLGDLPAKDPPLARSILYAKLLAALLLDDLTTRFMDFSPWGYRLPATSAVAVEDPPNVG